MSSNSNSVVSDEVESNTPISDQGVARSLPIPQGLGNDARDVFMNMMNQWFT